METEGIESRLELCKMVHRETIHVFWSGREAFPVTQTSFIIIA